MGSAVQPAAWVGTIHSTEAGGRETSRPLRDPGEAVTTELALRERGPHGRLHPALLEGPDHRCPARCYVNHTWKMTPVSKAPAARGRHQRQERRSDVEAKLDEGKLGQGGQSGSSEPGWAGRSLAWSRLGGAGVGGGARGRLRPGHALSRRGARLPGVGGAAGQPGGLTAAPPAAGRGLQGGASPQRLSHT